MAFRGVTKRRNFFLVRFFPLSFSCQYFIQVDVSNNEDVRRSTTQSTRMALAPCNLKERIWYLYLTYIGNCDMECSVCFGRWFLAILLQDVNGFRYIRIKFISIPLVTRHATMITMVVRAKVAVVKDTLYDRELQFRQLIRHNTGRLSIFSMYINKRYRSRLLSFLGDFGIYFLRFTSQRIRDSFAVNETIT